VAKAGLKGLPDGLKVDRAGNLFATGPGGVHVFASDGSHLGTFATGEATANCAWGDDGSTLYITADMYLVRVKLTTKGFDLATIFSASPRKERRFLTALDGSRKDLRLGREISCESSIVCKA